MRFLGLRQCAVYGEQPMTLEHLSLLGCRSARLKRQGTTSQDRLGRLGELCCSGLGWRQEGRSDEMLRLLVEDALSLERDRPMRAEGLRRLLPLKAPRGHAATEPATKERLGGLRERAAPCQRKGATRQDALRCLEHRRARRASWRSDPGGMQGVILLGAGALGAEGQRAVGLETLRCLRALRAAGDPWCEPAAGVEHLRGLCQRGTGLERQLRIGLYGLELLLRHQTAGLCWRADAMGRERLGLLKRRQACAQSDSGTRQKTLGLLRQRRAPVAFPVHGGRERLIGLRALKLGLETQGRSRMT